MEVSELESRLQNLESYNVWTRAADEMKAARAESPSDVNDRSSVGDLKARINLLESKDAEEAARISLAIDVTKEVDKRFSVPEAIGLVATLKHFSEETDDEKWWRYSHVDEQEVRPNPTMLGRSVQIIDEIERLAGVFDTNDPVPTVVVWKQNFHPPRISYNVVILCEATTPKTSFKLTPPELVGEDKELVKVTVPDQLNDLKLVEKVRKFEYLEPASRYETPGIPTICKLLKLRVPENVEALYVGDEVEARLQEAGFQNQQYREQLERRAARNRRRRPIIRGSR